MITVHMETNIIPLVGRHKDRRMTRNRRVNPGRRKMVRFDAMGGDRRSGYARRITDEGFRKQPEEK